MYRRFLRSFSGHENIFKQYLKQAEKIAEEAKIKADEVKQDTENILGAVVSSVDPALRYLRSSRLIDKLITARSTEKMQLLLEEAFHDVSKNYKLKKDSESDLLTPNDLAEKLMILWDERPDLKILNVKPNSILRSIWINPITEVKDYFGKFQRITKDEEGEFSPFFYGEFGDSFYVSMVRGVGQSPLGVRIIRRILDNMAAFNQKPSQELINVIVEESIVGRWPRVLMTALEYAVKAKTLITIETWTEVIKFYRGCSKNYDQTTKCLELALQSGITPD